MPGIRSLSWSSRASEFFFAHGHSYNIDEGLDGIYQEAKSRKARLVLFGHSHEPKIMEETAWSCSIRATFAWGKRGIVLAVIRIEFPKIFLGIFNPNQKGFIDV